MSSHDHLGNSSRDWHRPNAPIDMDSPSQLHDYEPRTTSLVTEPGGNTAEFDIELQGQDASPTTTKAGPRASTPHPSPQGSRRPSMTRYRSSSIGRTPPAGPSSKRYNNIPRRGSASSNYSTHDDPDTDYTPHEGDRKKPERAGQYRDGSPPPSRADDKSANAQPTVEKMPFHALKELILRAADEAMSGGRRIHLEISEDHWEVAAYAAGSRRGSLEEKLEISESRLQGAYPRNTKDLSLTSTAMMAARDDDLREGRLLRAAQESLRKSLDASLAHDRLLNGRSSQLGAELRTNTWGDRHLQREIDAFVAALAEGERLRAEVEKDMTRVEGLVQEGASMFAPPKVDARRRSGLGFFQVVERVPIQWMREIERGGFDTRGHC